jgi:hypothetical protein
VTTALQHIIAEARALANDGPCAAGHTWMTEGGRPCPHYGTDRECDHRSQAVYVCVKCGQYDYGEPGGPGHADCQRSCRP